MEEEGGGGSEVVVEENEDRGEKMVAWRRWGSTRGGDKEVLGGSSWGSGGDERSMSVQNGMEGGGKWSTPPFVSIGRTSQRELQAACGRA